MRVSRKISMYRAQRSQQGCSLSLGMLRLAEPPTGRARLRSSLKSPRNPITPFETSRVSTLHPGLYKNLREDANPPRPPSSREGDRPQAVEGVSLIICPTCAACVGHMIFFVSEELEWAGRTGRTAGTWNDRRVFGTNDPSALHPQTDRLWYNRGVRVTRKNG